MCFSADLKVGTTYCGQRPGAPVKQTIEVGVRASEDKTREPATSARTRLGPSAMAMSNNAGDVFCRADDWFAEPVLSGADAGQG